MITFRGRISIPKFDANRYTKKLEEEIQTQLRQAAREWLRAVIVKVPVWTGTSRGSLKPLGRFLRIAIPINPVVVRPRRGPEVGESKGGFQFERRGHRFLFKFSTRVLHFLDNEFNDTKNTTNPNLINPTPWNAFIAGKTAFDAYMKEIAPKRLPKVKDYIKFKSVRLGP